MRPSVSVTMTREDFSPVFEFPAFYYKKNSFSILTNVGRGNAEAHESPHFPGLENA